MTKKQKKNIFRKVGDSIQAIPEKVTGNNDPKIALKKFLISLLITALGGVLVWLTTDLNWKQLIPLVIIPAIQAAMNWLKHYNGEE